MGRKTIAALRATQRTIRATPLSDDDRARLRTQATYEGSPHHKRSPGDFGLTPPAAPRLDKTLCDEAGVLQRALAGELFRAAIDTGLVSEQTAGNGMPKQLWVVSATGQVFEVMYGGSRVGCYHGYPIRRSDPFHQEILDKWEGRRWLP